MSTAFPTLDIRRFTHPASAADRDAFVAELGAAYREWGFAGIRDHGIPQALIDGAYDVFQQFFALPDDDQAQVPRARQRRRARLHAVRRRDREGLASTPTSRSSGTSAARSRAIRKYADVMPPNLWPDEVAGVPRARLRPVPGAGPARLAGARGAGAAHRPAGGLLRRQDRLRQLDPAPDPLPADHHAPTSPTCAPARTRTST